MGPTVSGAGIFLIPPACWRQPATKNDRLVDD